MLQVGVVLVPIISLYVAKRASSNAVRIRAILAVIAGGFLYLLWYAPTILINANIIDFQIAQFGIVFRNFFATRVENTVTGLLWGILLPVNLVIAASGTRIRKLYAARKWVTISFWIATAYIILGEALSVVGSTALHGLVIPAITTALNWGQEIVDELV